MIFITQILSDFNNLSNNSLSVKKNVRNFIREKWKDYTSAFSLETLNKEVQEAVTKVILAKLLCLCSMFSNAPQYAAAHPHLWFISMFTPISSRNEKLPCSAFNVAFSRLIRFVYVLKHIDELGKHIAELNDEIDNNISEHDKATGCAAGQHSRHRCRQY